ncbi:MAG: hypothetical protein AAFU78_20830, partial [Cyanobacteria bacterium J06633_2]
MDEKKQILMQTMALLMSTTPDTVLGRFLNFCLATKVDPAIAHKTPFELAQELIEHPETLKKWIAEAVDSDGDYSVDEMIALSELNIHDSQQFMEKLVLELEA